MSLRLTTWRCTIPSTIFNGLKVKCLKDIFNVNDNADILTGSSDDPRSVAKDAPIGSLYIKSDTGEHFRKLDAGSSTNWELVGSGGASGINYIENNDFESGIDGWVEFDDGAVSEPVDGTGGTALNITLSASSTAADILMGTQTGKIVKTSSDAQGEGISYDFDIDPTFQGGQLEISFRYKQSANMASGDIGVWVYDKTNANLLQVLQDNSPDINRSATEGSYFLGRFQPASDSTAYRLIIMIKTTSALAYDLMVDDFKCGPQMTTPGHISSEFTAYTPTGNWNTNVNYEGFWKRDGDMMHVIAIANLTGAPNATSFTISVPSGYTIDTAKLVETAPNIQTLGTLSVLDSGTGVLGGFVRYSSTTEVVGYASTTTSDAQMSHLVPITFANNDQVSVEFRVPISGWKATQTLSTTQAVNQTVRAIYDVSASTANISFADVTFETVDYDTKVIDSHNSVTTGSGWVFTAPRDGEYKVSVNFEWNSASALIDTILQITVNAGSSTVRLFRIEGLASRGAGGSQAVTLSKGDTIAIEARQDDTGGGARSITTVAGLNRVSIVSEPDFNTFSVVGPIITDWAAYTPGSTWSTNTTVTGFYKRVSDTLHGRVHFAFTGQPDTGQIVFDLPTGLTIDTSKLTSTAEPTTMFGLAKLNDSGTGQATGHVTWNDSNTLSIQYTKVTSGSDGDTVANVTRTAPFTIASGDVIEATFSVPILQWNT